MNMEKDFESGVKLIRDAYRTQLSRKEAEIVRLSSENARKDAHIRDMETKISQLEKQLERADKRLVDMSKSLSKLHHFKQNVLESFEVNDLESLGLSNLTTVNPQTSYRPNLAGNSFNKTAETSLFGESFDFGRISTNSTRAHPLYASQRRTAQQPPSQPPASTDALNGSVTNTNTSVPTATVSNESVSAVVDGRAYFKKLKALLTYDEFSTLIKQVKLYNGREISKAQVLQSAHAILGERYPDIYGEFESLVAGENSNQQ